MRKSFAYLLLVGTLFFTGCSKSVVLTGNESDVLSDYMANVVLKHAENYENNLYTVNEINEIEAAVVAREEKFMNAKENSENALVVDTKTLEDKSEQNNDKEVKKSEISNTNQVVNMSNITSTIGNSNFNIKYTGYKLMESYTEDSSRIQVDATDGRQLLVIKFSIKNQSKSTVKLDLVEEGIKYQLQGKGITEKPILTLLMNDIQYYNMDIEGSKTKEAVILFEIDKQLDLSGAQLIVTRDSSTSNIDLK